MNRQGLVAVKRMVTRNGNTYLTTVWVRPQDAAKASNQTINIPDFKFSDVKSFEDLINRIAKIKDSSERKIVKNHLIEHLKNSGITWKEDKGVKADDINWMRALMATKKHLKGGNKVSSDSSKTKATVVLGTGKPMSKEEAKKAVSDLRDKIGTQAVMDLAEKNGIQWAKNPNHIANSYMQCAMKLSKHLQAGGVLTDSGVNLVVSVDKDKVPKEKPKKEPKPMTLAWDYHHATPKQKLLGIVTGIVPTDDETTEYIDSLLRAGTFDLRFNIDESKYKLPKDYVRVIQTTYDDLYGFPLRYWSEAHRIRPFVADSLFKGTKYEKDYNTFMKHHNSFDAKHGSSVYSFGPESVKTQTKFVELLDQIAKRESTSVASLNKRQLYEGVLNIFESAASNPKEAERIWDEYNMSHWIDQIRDVYYPESPFATAMRFLDGDNFIAKFLLNSATRYNSTRAFVQNVNNGQIPKREVMKLLASTLRQFEPSSNKGEENVVEDMREDKRNGSYALGPMRRSPLIQRFLATRSRNGFNVEEFYKYSKEVAEDWKPLLSKDAYYFREQIILRQNLLSQNKLSGMVGYEPVDKEVWFRAGKDNLKQILEEHLYLMRKAPGEAREKARKQIEKSKGKDASEIKREMYWAWKEGKDLDKLEFPDFEKIEKFAKCSLDKLPDAEAKKVENRINQTHDTVHHPNFRTKVRGVYRIKNLPIEQDFKEIDQKRDNTSFYYHGTDFKAAHKILGESGRFIVRPRKDAKAGRMLGDGIYLAEHSSKSMQYVGGQYIPGGFSTERGVLFVCKASLGKVETVKVKGYSYCNEVLKRKDVDTVACLRPHVLNPEWAVKEEKAVIPRLWIDAERVRV